MLGYVIGCVYTAVVPVEKGIMCGYLFPANYLIKVSYWFVLFGLSSFMRHVYKGKFNVC